MGSDIVNKRSQQRSNRIKSLLLVVMIVISLFIVLRNYSTRNSSSLRSIIIKDTTTATTTTTITSNSNSNNILEGIYKFSVPDSNGNEISLSKYVGSKATLIVNTASH